MKKSILNFSGAKELTKSDLKEVNAGIGLCRDSSGRMGPCEKDGTPGSGTCFSQEWPHFVDC